RLAERHGLTDAAHEIAGAGHADVLARKLEAVALAATQLADGIAIAAVLDPLRRTVRAGKRQRRGRENGSKHETRYTSIAYQGHGPLRFPGRRPSVVCEKLISR